MQLVQPSVWDATGDDLLDILARAQDLVDCVGTAMPCVSAPPVLGLTTSQRACNIAGYVANVVVKGSIQRAIDSINAGNTVIDYGILIISFIPDVGLVVPALAQGLKDLYATISGGSLTSYEDAAADETLWSKVTCAIYDAISADGQITDSNWPTVKSNVHAIAYASTDVQEAIDAYLSDMGATVAQTLQSTGALADYDCSSCGTGVSTGPAGLAARLVAGAVSITIPAGDASASASVTWPAAFGAAPIVGLSCESTVLIASAGSKTATGCTITLSAAVPVTADTTAVVDYIATVAGGF